MTTLPVSILRGHPAETGDVVVFPRRFARRPGTVESTSYCTGRGGERELLSRGSLLPRGRPLKSPKIRGEKADRPDTGATLADEIHRQVQR